MYAKLWFVMTLAGAVLIFVAIRDFQLNAACRENPQSLTARQLGTNGCGDNAYITLRGFRPAGSYVVHPKPNDAPGRWEWALVPVVSNEPDASQVGAGATTQTGVRKTQPPTEIKKFDALLRFLNCDQATVDAALARGEVAGIVIDLVFSIRSGDEEELRQMYPGVDPTRAPLFDVGRKPGGMPGLVVTAGGVLFLVGVGGLIAVFKR